MRRGAGSSSIMLVGVVLAMTLASSGFAREAIGRERLTQLSHSDADRSFALLRQLLSLPNDAHFPEEHLQPNLVWMEGALAARGFTTRRLESGGFPLLLAERPVEGADDTVLVYLQIDGQPVDPNRWDQADAWSPVVKRRSAAGWEELEWSRLNGGADREWRIFARSASDAKGPVAMFLRALDLLSGEGREPAFHLKVILDFEEELGSPRLARTVERYREALEADMLVIFDGPMHYSNRPSLTFGARGIATVELRVFGPRVPQHSGHFGNYVPNPAQRLAQLLASMKDAEGRVVIPHFYDGVELDPATREILALVPDDEEAMRSKLGIATPDAVAPTYQESLQYPSLNVRGLSAGWVGEQVRTIIPATAVAEIDLRLTPESDPERLIGALRDHIEGQGFHLVDGEPTDEQRRQYDRLASISHEVAYAAFRTPLDSRVGRWLVGALERAFDQTPVRKRMSGGSIPISPFVTTLGLPAVMVPTVNSDNNQHSPNENLRVGNFFDGIRTFLAILTEPIPGA